MGTASVTGQRKAILVGMAAGAVWGLVLVRIGVTQVNLPIFTQVPMLVFAFLGPGLVLLALIGRLAQRRFFDDSIIDGKPFVPNSSADIDARVLQNTMEQMVLALALWPTITYLMLGDGPGVVACLGIGFVIARLAFWIGYHVSPPLRAFGFAATFYPTIIALIWALIARVT